MATEILASELKACLERGDDLLLVDVREPAEHRARCIPEAVLIPLGELPKRLNELDRDKLTVVHCKSGMRSATACQLLRAAGFKNVLNLRGGIEAWI
jgi:adenylyltransferase/sulfurtransferase